MMIGMAYKKLAEVKSMHQSNGVAYGEIDGFMTTFSEGLGNKDLFISLCLENEETLDILNKALRDTKTRRSYRIMSHQVTDKSVSVSFFDKPGTIKCIRSFIDWFYPFLKTSGGYGTNYCPECGRQITGADRAKKLINGSAVVLHNSCAQKLAFDFKQSDDVVLAERSNMGRGFLGALLGGLAGAIPWAIAYALGWFVGVLGFVIGFCAKKGYLLMGGKIRKATIVIIGISVVVSVLFGQLLGDCMSIGYYIIKGEIESATFADIPYIIVRLFETKREYVVDFLKNIGIGLFFAIWGVIGIFRETGKQVKAAKPSIIDIE